MPRFKNIRIKMKGGKTRLQRVMVLASGKYKFVKNLTRSRSSPKKKGKTSRKRRKSNPKKGGNRKMGRRGLTSQKIFSIAKQLALASAGIDAAMRPGTIHEKVKWVMRDYTGWNMDTNTFEAGNLVRGYGPFVAVSLVQKVVQFANKLLR